MVDLKQYRERVARAIYDCPACGDTVAEIIADSEYLDIAQTAAEVTKGVMDVCILIADAALAEIEAVLAPVIEE